MGVLGNNKPPGWGTLDGDIGTSQGGGAGMSQQNVPSGQLNGGATLTATAISAHRQAVAQHAAHLGAVRQHVWNSGQVLTADMLNKTVVDLERLNSMIERPTAPPEGESIDVLDIKKMICDGQIGSHKCFCFTVFNGYKRPTREVLLEEYRWVLNRHGMPGATRWINSLSNTEQAMLRDALDGSARDNAL